MPKLAILVEFEIADGREAELVALLAEHARLTLEEEAGCLVFDLIRPIERDGTPIPNRLLLTEIYQDEAAVSIHEKNPRMPGLLAALQPMIVSMKQTLGRID